MSPEVSRRKLMYGVIGSVAGVGVLGTSGYIWHQHSTRDHLTLDLWGINRSSEPVELSVTALAGESVIHDGTYTLESEGHEHGDDELPINGPWINSARRYSLEIETVTDSMIIEHHELINSFSDVGWGSECVQVEIIVNEDRSLDAHWDGC